MIKNIVFDLGNVLLKDSPRIVINDIRISDELRKRLDRFFCNWESIDLGEETLNEHFNNCNFEFEMGIEIKELLINYYKYRSFNYEMIELMNRLKQNEYKIFILSNNNRDAYEYIKKQHMFECVDGWIISCDFHIVKPNSELYMKLFNIYNIKPEECFFIDDSNENIEMGKKLGMNGCVFNNKIDDIVKILKANKIKGI